MRLREHEIGPLANVALPELWKLYAFVAPSKSRQLVKVSQACEAHFREPISSTWSCKF